MITYVTKDGWNVSYQSGWDGDQRIPEGMVKLGVFHSDSWEGLGKGFTRKGLRDGEQMTKEEAVAHCLEHGYLQVYVPKG